MDMLSIASINSEISPIEWAVSHVEDLIAYARDCSDDLPSWLQRCLKGLPAGPDSDWLWQAPRFVVMEPFRDEPYLESAAWELLDPLDSLKEADRCADELIARLKRELRQCKLAHSRGLNMDPTNQEAHRKFHANEAGGEVRPAHHKASRELPCTASEDFRSVLYEGKPYTLTRQQGRMLEVLIEAYRRGHCVVDKDRLLRAAEAETSEVRNFWRNSPLWRTLITSPRKGAYELAHASSPSKRFPDLHRPTRQRPG